MHKDFLCQLEKYVIIYVFSWQFLIDRDKVLHGLCYVFLFDRHITYYVNKISKTHWKSSPGYSQYTSLRLYYTTVMDLAFHHKVQMWIQNSQIVFVCTIKQLVVCWAYAFWFSGIRRQGMKRSCCHNEKEQIGNLKELSQHTPGESAISAHSGTHMVPWYHHQWHGKMHLHWKGTGSNFKICIYLSFSFIQ